MEKLQELFSHIREIHGYEPLDWLGWGEDELTTRQRYLEWRKTHTKEHREWYWYYDPREWEDIYKHPIGSRHSTPRNPRILERA